MKPQDCPKYEGCNANICPLDTQRHRRRHLPSEPVCFWLREWSKSEGQALIRGRLTPEFQENLAITYQEVMVGPHPPEMGWGMIQRELKKSSQVGSKLASGERLRKA